MHSKVRTITLMAMLVSVALVITSIAGETNLITPVAHASTDAEIKRLKEEIKQIEQNEQDAEQKRQELQQQLKDLETRQAKEEQALKEIESRISRTEERIRQKEKEVEATKEKAHQTALELKEAEERVEERRELLKTRLRSIYESGGTVSYLDVLMGAGSIGDFLQRLDLLSIIMETDQQILTEFIEEQKRIEQKKQELDQLLAQLDEQLTELAALQSRLRAEKKEQEVKIASLREEQEQVKEYDEKEQQRLLELANQKSRLIREKHAAELKKMEEERKRQEEERRRQQQAASGASPANNSGSSASGNQAATGGGQLAWPVSPYYPINSGYRPPHRPNHNGVDMAAPRGTNIVAAEAGIVSHVVSGCREGDSSCGGGFGNYVVIAHPNGINTLYAHASSILVSVGDPVSRGQVIAKVGNTGRSTGPHLHFEVHKNGQRVNPTPYLW
ncbi:murein DD-endopeptidase MepM/ murein hydrolase activator NlpD [Caldalkalibacillus uzonensis]|uniref:Murein DD-endopeptidase MepM/ murein hydrolase activator NlpD n=1 Tax=Caldalkalibacillus uzonensis TaxID=353224 RepID=A0ABU0CUA7_9BACI|nr:peptidoglycan DD-metalloendopeptidase family protein [Caldalkalibacillus uzonensis]MDQ0340000.1 murein DD-endopeptidase MepM/ murein hydrolase activator NlpD [Caldalkalibacillus uzonensis]